MSLDWACVAQSRKAWYQSGQPDQQEEEHLSDPCPQGHSPREAQAENRMLMTCPQGWVALRDQGSEKWGHRKRKKRLQWAHPAVKGSRESAQPRVRGALVPSATHNIDCYDVLVRLRSVSHSAVQSNAWLCVGKGHRESWTSGGERQQQQWWWQQWQQQQVRQKAIESGLR